MKKTNPLNSQVAGTKTSAVAKKAYDEDTRSCIIRVAAMLFSEKGFHGTSVDDITRASNISKGAFYWHFESKEDLLKSFLKEWEQQFLNGLVEAIRDTEGGVEEKFNSLYRFIALFALNNRELCVSFDTLSGEFVGARHRIEGEFKRIYARYQDVLHRLIEEGQREKKLRPDLDSKLTALILMSFHHGILLQWSMNRSVLDGEVFLDTYRSILKQGMFLGEDGR